MSRREPISTPRLTLVPLDAASAAELVEGRNGALVAGDLVTDSSAAGPLVAGRGWPHADTLDGLVGALASGDADALPWLVVLLDPDQSNAAFVIGDVGWKGTPGLDGRVEIGYGLAAPYRGEGLATEAVGAFVDWLAARPDVLRIDAEVHVGNVASRRLLESLGFTIELVEAGYVWYGRSTPKRR